jgi:RNA recognition motif-containing protein
MSQKRDIDDSCTKDPEEETTVPTTTLTVEGEAPEEESSPASKKQRVDDDAPEENAENNNDKKEEEKESESKPAKSNDTATADEPELELDPEDEPTGETDTKSQPEKLTFASIVLFGLHPLVTKPKLEKLMEKFGPIEQIDVKMAFASRYGCCEYKSIGDAQKAMDVLNGRGLMGKKIMVRPGSGARSKPRTDL